MTDIVQSGLVPLLDEQTGRFPDEFAPPSVAADAVAARDAAEAAGRAQEAAEAAENNAAEHEREAGQIVEDATATIPGLISEQVVAQIDPKVAAATQAKTDAETARDAAQTARDDALQAKAQAVAARVDTIAALAATEVDQITLTGNLALTIPEGHPAGQVYRCAITQTTGGHTVTYDDMPLIIDTDPGASTLVEFWPGGKVTYPGVAVGTPGATPGPRASVDPSEAVAPIGQTPASITTYTGGNEVVHPSVIHFPNGWNGYRYWMAYTPLDGGDSQYENPCLAVSDDGDTWVTPAGLTNPLDPNPGIPNHYNSDTNISMLPDGRMMLLWRLNSPAGRTIFGSTSRDGITWTPKVVLREPDTNKVLAPCVQWTGDDYLVWTVEDGPTPNVLQVRRVADVTAPGSMSVAATVCTHNLPATADLWHMDVVRHGGTYFAVAQVVESAGWYFYFGQSYDGIAWTFGRSRFMRKGAGAASTYYKAAIQPVASSTGLEFDMWYSTAGVGYRLYRTQIDFGRTRRIRDRLGDVAAACNGLAPWIVGDTFNRADTTAGLGTATSGAIWSRVMGTDWGIASGKAYQTTATNSRTILDTGSGNHFVEAEFSTLGSSGYLIARYADANNLWRVGNSGNGLVMQKIVAGTVTSLANIIRVEPGDSIAVEAVGASVMVYLNRVLAYRATDTELTAGTKVGLTTSDIAARWDNFVARAIW